MLWKGAGVNLGQGITESLAGERAKVHCLRKAHDLITKTIII